MAVEDKDQQEGGVPTTINITQSEQRLLLSMPPSAVDKPIAIPSSVRKWKIYLLRQCRLRETDRRVKKSESVITRAFYSAHGAIIMNGLTTLSRSSNSIAKVLQPQLARKLTELNILSRRLLRPSNTAKQPLYRMKDKKVFFYDIISYPAKAALTSLMCVSYAALIFLAVSINKFLGKIKGIVQTEDTSRESSSEDENGIPKAPEATPPLQQDTSIFPIKASQNSGSIHTLLAAVDQESEQ